VDDYKAVKLPILDLYGDTDLQGAGECGQAQQSLAAKDSRQVMIARTGPLLHRVTKPRW